LARFSTVAVTIYLVLIIALVVTAWAALAAIADRRNAVGATAEALAQLEQRLPSLRSPVDVPAGAVPTGSPFLEGDTVTVAGAALLQRVAGAVTRAGGNVLSSQVDVKSQQSTDGYVNLIASCEIEQSALQQLLYELEAGMPFLFVEQLVAQTTQAALAADTAKMRVLLMVSGQWQGAK
jgi:general secretion pathway protein M